MGGQGDELVEPLPLKEVAERIALCGADVDVADDQGVLFWGEEVSQVVGCSERGLVLGSVDVYYVNLLQDDLAQLQVRLSKVVDTFNLQAFLYKNCHSFSTTLAGEVTPISLQLISFLPLFTLL